jgi:hypothetical protein
MTTRKPQSFTVFIILWAVVCALPADPGLALALDHTTIKSYPTASFSTGWTHIINTPNGILWYNTQAGAVGRLD